MSPTPFTDRIVFASRERDHDEVLRLAHRVDSLPDAIAQATAGGAAPVDWLRQAIRDYLAGRPIQEPTP